MSELIASKTGARKIRLRLMITASALVLAGVAGTDVNAEEADRPVLWVEIGGQLESVSGTDIHLLPPFLEHSPRAAIFDPSPVDVLRPPGNAAGWQGKLTLEPNGTNWVFSAALRYGRSDRSKSFHQQTAVPPITFSGTQTLAPNLELADYGQGRSTQSHVVVDFQAGKDVGLGLFGRGGHSTVSAGVRYAQFNAKTSAIMQSRPDLGTISHILGSIFKYHPHTYTATISHARSFHGIGPSLSWDASAPLIGNPDASHVTLDWGVNAAVLFGRQKVSVQHQTTGVHRTVSNLGFYGGIISSYAHPHRRTQSRSVVVPNIGGFAGFSLRFPNAKISLGYRADFFLGAMDVGLDTRSGKTVGFNGPFATISIGLGG